MHAAALTLLRCPVCRGALTLVAAQLGAAGNVPSGTLSCACGETFEIDDGIPDLVRPRQQAYIEEDPHAYDALVDFIARLLRSDERAARRRFAALLEVDRGDRVLEVGCGPGSNFPFVLDRIGRCGELYALDISPGMIRKARQRPVLETDRAHLLLANGVHLPFADAVFDAVLQMGTLNRFSDIPGGLAEMARVTKRGGKVVVGDEGLGPWLRNTEYAALLSRFGGLFKGHVPIAALPTRAEEVHIRWELGHAYYVMDFRVGEPPSADLDVRLPGRQVTVRDVLAKSPAKDSS